MTEPGGPRAAWPEGLGTIAHVDMDAFFVSVELLRHPELVGLPVVVGGTGERGVVAAASYEARAYGIHSAMPSARARRQCPDAVFLRGDHRLYSEVSARLMELLSEVTPLVEPLSLDEAFLDLSGTRLLHGDPIGVAERIRSEVLCREGLGCSVGLAVNKFLAKLASDEAKPRPSVDGPLPGAGVFPVWPGTELDFLHPLPVRRLWGVGPATLERLERLGVGTVGDLAELPVETVMSALGDAAGRHLHRLANGVDDRTVEVGRAPQSIGHEETFPSDLHDYERLDAEIVRMADAVAARARSARLAGRTLTLKIRFGDFRTVTRSVTFPGGTDSGRSLAEEGRRLLRSVDPAGGVRLLGLGLSNLVDGTERQLSFDDAASDWDEADRVVDRIRSRFGRTSIGPASTVGAGGLRVKQRGEQQWGPDEWQPGRGGDAS